MATLIPFLGGALGLSFWINRQPLDPRRRQRTC
jgi:hypothetical protein